tara:strand:- start:5590 stop:6723 length:1134 start_codon:yes stop_codon:yes gene_type:complete
MNKRKKIILVSNACWQLFNFRKNTIKKLLLDGYDVEVIAPRDDCTENLELLGCNFSHISLGSSGKNPFKDIGTIFKLIYLYKKLKPDLVLNFTPKINIYSTLAGSFLKIQCINNIAGLGTAFIETGLTSKLVGFLYMISQPLASVVFFQNQEDMDLFNKKGWAKKKKSIRIMGSGVDLNHFKVMDAPDDNIIRFLFVGRILEEKGVLDLINASRLLKQNYNNFELQILGWTDSDKNDQIKLNDILSLEKEGVVNYLGYHTNVADFIANADCIVLPSYYREGVPRSLLESAAMGKPIISTNTIGCRETIDDGLNGFFCKTEDPEDLAKKMELIINMTHGERVRMGHRGRDKIEKEFDEKYVIEEYMKAIEEIIKNKEL